MESLVFIEDPGERVGVVDAIGRKYFMKSAVGQWDVVESSMMLEAGEIALRCQDR